MRLERLSAELDGGARGVALFNGRNLEGWSAFLADGSDPAAVWSVGKDGVLICKGTPTGYLYTDQGYLDYILELEWRWDPETKQAGNSGVLLRMGGEHKIWPDCLEAQLKSGGAGDIVVMGDFQAKTFPERTKGRYAVHSRANEKPVGEWNHYRIVVDHGVATLMVNGAELNQAVGVLETRGPIGLQSEGAPIHFRNIVLTPLR